MGIRGTRPGATGRAQDKPAPCPHGPARDSRQRVLPARDSRPLDRRLRGVLSLAPQQHVVAAVCPAGGLHRDDSAERRGGGQWEL